MRVRSDSSAARGMCHRQGPGKVKHLSIKKLFVQELVQNKVISLDKVGADENRADIGTKHLTRARLEQLVRMLGMVRYINGQLVQVGAEINMIASFDEDMGGIIDDHDRDDDDDFVEGERHPDWLLDSGTQIAESDATGARVLIASYEGLRAHSARLRNVVDLLVTESARAHSYY